ncbi:MAG: hypothetical protein HZC42_06630 [Candidatus Eisenbacteria bacterium]|nr:hypothetical protein [Candidatus Eisenbacteria bacterium]
MTTSPRSSRRVRREPPRILRLEESPAVARVRWARVETARARIAAGYYDRAEIRERLADAVLEELDKS